MFGTCVKRRATSPINRFGKLPGRFSGGTVVLGPGRADDRVCAWVFSTKALGSGPSESRYPDPGTDYRHCGSSLARGNRTSMYPIDPILVWFRPRTASSTAATVTGRANLYHGEESSAAPAQQTKKAFSHPRERETEGRSSSAWDGSLPAVPQPRTSSRARSRFPLLCVALRRCSRGSTEKTAWARTSLSPGIEGRHRQSRVQSPPSPRAKKPRPGV